MLTLTTRLDRLPLNLAAVVDRSGSMHGPTPQSTTVEVMEETAGTGDAYAAVQAQALRQQADEQLRHQSFQARRR